MSVPARGGPDHGVDAAAGGAALARARQFHGLDALRGVAAGAVVLFHANFLFGLAKPPMAFLAVDLFFAMSGFIIAHRYDGDLAAGMTARAFAALRLARLYPLFLLGTLIGALPVALTIALRARSGDHAVLLSALPAAVLMLPSRAALPEVQTLYPLNFVSWSLAFEIVANLCYAALFRRLGLRALAAVTAAGLLGLCFCAARWHTLEVGFEWPHAAGGFARIGFAFPLGVLLRRLTLPAPREGTPALRLPAVPWPVPLAAATALLCLPAPCDVALWSLAGCTLGVPLILAAAVAGEPPRRLDRACGTAGVYSYVLYSLHVPLVGLWLRAATRLHGDVDHPGPLGALAYVAMVALVCVAAHHGYDRPVRRLLLRRLGARVPRAPRARPGRRRAVEC